MSIFSLVSDLIQEQKKSNTRKPSVCFNSLLYALMTAGLLLVFPIIFPSQSIALNPVPTLTVCFTPGEDCTARIVSAIDDAQRTISVQAYSFTSPPIAKALRDAHQRGVHITVILDKSQVREQYSSADFLARAGIPTFIDSKHAIAHNKIILIDQDTIITGSFNFTRSAQDRNAENVLIIRGDPVLREQYVTNFSRHQAHSQPYTPR